ncbi:MAG: signal peptidase I [Clostridia bacterium]|nr:signal peptidase I [Clostridia bacterium]
MSEKRLEKAVKLNKEDELSGAQRAAREIFDWIQTFCGALLFGVILFTFFFRIVTVDGESMTQTLQNGDRLIISNLFYEPARGDIVVVHDTETKIMMGQDAFSGPIIKRVIATEGEKVKIDYNNWTVTVTDVNGKETVLQEPYVNYIFYDETNVLKPIKSPERIIYPDSIANNVEHTVKEGCVFVCGDNRSNSLDSRYVGDVDKRKILGKALFRVFPFNALGALYHAEYNT